PDGGRHRRRRLHPRPRSRPRAGHGHRGDDVPRGPARGPVLRAHGRRAAVPRRQPGERRAHDRAAGPHGPRRAQPPTTAPGTEAGSSLTGAARATTAQPGGGGTMADSTLSRQTFLRLGGALGGALAATGMVAGGASAAPRPRVPAPRASGGPLLEGGEFPIGIFWPPPPYQTTVDRYRQIVDAGFTYVHSNNYLFADWQIQQHALRIADQVGLKVLVDDDDLRWITRNFRISDDGGPFTLTRDEAETLVRQIVNRYAPTRYWRLRDGRLLFDGGTGDGSIGWALDGAGWTDYTFEFTATPLPTGAGGYAQAGWAFRVQDERNAYVWIIGDRDTGGWNGNLTRAIFVDGAPQVTTVQ